MSCHSDFILNQNHSISKLEKHSSPVFLKQYLDSIQWNRSVKLRKQDYIAESIFYKAKFDYDSCTFLQASRPDIKAYYERNSLYFFTAKNCLFQPHSLEFSDIDDYYVSIKEPEYIFGSYKGYSILKIPLKSNLECISELSVILSYDHFCLEEDVTQL